MNVTCPHCGNETAGGRVLCAHCGQKIHTAPARKSAPGRALAGVGKLIGKLVRLVVRLTVTVCVLGCFALLLWPIQPTGAAGTSSEGERVKRALQLLEETPGQQVILREEELNGYLQAQLDANDASGTVVIDGLNVDLVKEQLLLNTSTLVGPLQISWELTLVPAVDNTFPFELKTARIGHLPMIGPLKNFAADKVARIFNEYETEKDVLESAKQIALDEGRIMLSN